MADMLTLGTAPASGTEEFDPAEIVGMRTTAWILFANACLNLVLFLAGAGGSPLQVPVDVFLGVQLLRLRHSWRAWVLLRAFLGLLIGVFALIGGLSTRTPFAGAMVGAGAIGFPASLLALLYGRPTMQRVRIGQVTFAVSLLLILAGSLGLDLTKR